MNGSLRIDISGLHLDRLHVLADVTPAALAAGMEHIRTVSVELVPVETGRLAASATVVIDGDTASITFAGPYARYQHENLTLRHEHGQAKFLEEPVITEANKALQIMAGIYRRAL